MWPWIYTEYRSSAPQGFVRNPYYFAVDPQGNQLPYLDRVLFDIKNHAMISAAITSGEITMQDRHIDFEEKWFAERYHAVSDSADQPVDLGAVGAYAEFMKRLSVRVANRKVAPRWHGSSVFSSVGTR